VGTEGKLRKYPGDGDQLTAKNLPCFGMLVYMDANATLFLSVSGGREDCP